MTQDPKSSDVLPALPRPYVPCDAENIYDFYTAGQMHSYAQQALADRERQAGEAVAWENSEGWESLAWELCADENGEESCNELIWEGGPVPEPWGERWLKYEDEAKRLIKLVHKHASTPAPQVVQADNLLIKQAEWDALSPDAKSALTDLCQRVQERQIEPRNALDREFSTPPVCPACNGAKVVGTPGAPCPLCKLHSFATPPAASKEQQAEAPKQEPFAWLVCSVNPDGSLSLEYAAPWREAAHEHINDAITEHGIEEASSWVVRPAYLNPQPDYDELEREHMGDYQKKTGIYATLPPASKAEPVAPVVQETFDVWLAGQPDSISEVWNIRHSHDGHEETARFVWNAIQPPQQPEASVAGEREAFNKTLDNVRTQVFDMLKDWHKINKDARTTHYLWQIMRNVEGFLGCLARGDYRAALATKPKDSNAGEQK